MAFQQKIEQVSPEMVAAIAAALIAGGFLGERRLRQEKKKNPWKIAGLREMMEKRLCSGVFFT